MRARRGYVGAVVLAVIIAMLFVSGCRRRQHDDATATAKVMTQPPIAQCMKDVDCKGERICQSGTCVNPSTEFQSPLPSPTPEASDTPIVGDAAGLPGLGPDTTSSDTFPQAAAGPAPLAAGLMRGMRSVYLNTLIPTIPRETGAPIREYAKASFFASKPTRVEHTDYWIFSKKARAFGLTLVALEEEYQGRTEDCCAKPGLGALFERDASTSELETFAAQNQCKLEAVDPVDSIYDYVTSLNPSRSYVAISCRANQ